MDLVQVLGFDASQALKNIDLTNSALKQLNANLNNVANTASKFNNNQLSQTLSNLGSGARKSADDTDQLTKALQSLGAIIKAQIIIRGITAISRGFREGIQDAREFQKAVGEIATLTNQNIPDLSERLKVDAETFGLDILDLAEAQYQLFSNQVDGASESTEAFTAALKLARATNSDATQSVNLLSSVLNSFGKSAEDAEETAGILFSLIEQGRVRTSELSNALGTVTPLAARLGVSFEEVAAQLAVITRQGVRANVALTQQRSIFNKLLKPSEALEEVFRRIGVIDATEGIRQFGGLIPFLQRINQEVEGNISLQADLFNNVRGLAGVLNTFANNGNDVNRVLADLGVTGTQSVERLNEAFQTATDNDAARLQRQINELRNTFIDLGEAALPVLTASLDGINTGIDIASNNFGTLAVVAGTTAGALGVLQIQAGATGAALAFFGVSLAPVATALVALGAGFFAGQKLIQSWNNQINQIDTALAQENVKELEATIRDIDLATERAQAGISSFTQSVSAELGRVADRNRSALDAIQNATQQFSATQISSFEELLDRRKTLLKNFEDAAKATERNVTDSQQTESDLRQQIADREFNRQISNFDDLGKSVRQLQRSQDTFGEAQQLVNTGNLEDAVSLLEQAGRQAQDALRSAQADGNAVAIAQAEQQITDVLNGRLTIQKLITQETERAGVAAEAAAEKERAAVKRIQDLTKDITSNLKILGDETINETDRKNAEKQVRDLIADLRNVAVSGESLDAAQLLGITNLAASAQADLASVSVNFEGDLNQLQSEVDALASQVIANIPFALELQDAGFGDINRFNIIGSVQQQVANLGDSAASSAKDLQLIESQQARVNTALETFRDVIGQVTGRSNFIEELVNAFNRLDVGGLNQLEADEFIKLLEAADNAGVIELAGIDSSDTQRLNNLRSALAAYVEETQKLGVLRTGFDPAELSRAQQGIQNLSGFQESSRIASLLNTTVSKVRTEAIALTDEFGKTTFSADGLATSLGTSVSQADELLSRLRDIKTTIETTPPPPAPQVQNQMFGGFMKRLAKGGSARYLNSGGFSSRGTDTVPAMLSPGEFVVNARAARTFASQLTAMNAGVRPVFRQEGGTVINNDLQVGSIDINGSQDPSSTARQVIAQLNREFRKGTARNRF